MKMLRKLIDVHYRSIQKGGGGGGLDMLLSGFIVLRCACMYVCACVCACVCVRACVHVHRPLL